MKNVITKFFRPCGFPAILLLFEMLFCALFFSCKPTSEELTILYDVPLEEVQKIAKEEDKVFCILLTRSGCFPCQQYVQKLGDLYSNAIFNVIDTYLPQNRWYMQWICTGSSPTTIVFSPNGKLKAVFSGDARPDHVQCIKASMSGETECAEHLYHKYFPIIGYDMPMLDTLLSVKQSLDKGEDVVQVFGANFAQSAHPYAAYLKSLNEAQQGRKEVAAYWASRFLSMINAYPYYSYIYGSLIRNAKIIIDPNYTSDNDSKLNVVEEFPLGNVKFHQSQSFSLTLTNTGKSLLVVHDIVIGCSCVTLKNAEKKQYTLQSGQSQTVDFVFTADVKGEISREISFFSNGVKPVEDVRITATVK